jgi:hypothetical protein
MSDEQFDENSFEGPWRAHKEEDFVFVESEDWQVVDDEWRSTLDERVGIQVCLYAGGFAPNVWKEPDAVTHLPTQPTKAAAIAALNLAFLRWNREMD